MVKERLKNVPLKPGVYLFKDGEGKVIYVGKAKALRNRMRSYFQSSEKLHPKVQAMMNRVADFDFVVTSSEVEALILENNLIKFYQPRYNIDLRDDKTYPYLKISIGEDFPRVYITREKKDGVSRYFGPYTDVTSLRETLRLLTTIFPLRTCKTLKARKRPCLNYDLHKCPAPCMAKISKQDYRQVADQLISFLEGDFREVLELKRGEMQAASHRLEFERAARLRDQIQAIEKLGATQKVVLNSPFNLDLIAMVGEEKEDLAQVFKIRGGKMIAQETFWLKRPINEEGSEVMGFFMQQFYADNHDIPAEIVVNILPAELEWVEEWLTELIGRKVQIKIPRRGDKKRLLEMAVETADLLWKEKHEKDKRQQEILLHLSQLLDLEVLPERIECFDISHLGGKETVAAMVVFRDGVPDYQAYRRFKIKTDQNDDFASLRETLKRRFKQAREANPAFLPEPDLVIIDGGLGQVNTVKGILDELQVDIPLFGLAEKNEEIYRPGNFHPLVLPRNDEGLKLLQRIRDEAHRFAIEYNRLRRSKKMTTSALDNIEGVGPQRRRALLSYFGSVAKIREASLEELNQVPGMNRRVAGQVYDYFRGSGGGKQDL
ncbi:excinuclease ABC subunit UvrC [Syntrophomonas erecta]